MPKPLLKLLLWDLGLPAVVYYGAHALGYDVEASLVAAGIAALLRVAYVAMLQRRLEAVAAVVTGVFAVLVVISVLTDDPRILLAKESVISGVSGVLLVGSCLVGRPLVYVLARKVRKEPDWDHRFEHDAAFRRKFTTLSLAFGGVLLADAVVRLILIYSLPVDTMANLSPIMHVVALALLGLAGLLFKNRRQRSLERSNAR